MPITITGSEELKKAVKLFNRWQFQEAIDAFAALAEEAEGREQTFLKALAQLSSAFYRIWHKGGEPNAMVDQLDKGIKQMKPFAKGALELDLAEFDPGLQDCLEEAKRWRRGDTDIFNRDFIPRIEFFSGEEA